VEHPHFWSRSQRFRWSDLDVLIALAESDDVSETPTASVFSLVKAPNSAGERSFTAPPAPLPGIGTPRHETTGFPGAARAPDREFRAPDSRVCRYIRACTRIDCGAVAMKPVMIKFPEDLLARIDAARSATGVGRSEWIRRAIEARLQSDGGPAETAHPQTSPARSTPSPVTTKAPAASHPTRPPLGRQAGSLDRDATPRFK